MRILIFILLMAFVSCSALQGYKKTDFVYYKDQKRKNMSLHIPKGYADEKVLLDTTGGKEQFYYYENGALLYFAKDVSWPTENQPLITEKTNSKSYPGQVFTYKGKDKEGLHWKEIRVDNFRFGYSYVPAHSLEKFEQAVNSIRIR